MSPTRAAGLGILTGMTLLWVGIFNWRMEGQMALDRGEETEIYPRDQIWDAYMEAQIWAEHFESRLIQTSRFATQVQMGIFVAALGIPLWLTSSAPLVQGVSQALILICALLLLFRFYLQTSKIEPLARYLQLWSLTSAKWHKVWLDYETMSSDEMSELIRSAQKFHQEASLRSLLGVSPDEVEEVR